MDFNEPANYQYILSKLDSLDIRILGYFYDENSIPIGQPTAFFYYKTASNKSERTFYNKVKKLERLGLILNTHGKSPAFYVVTSKAISLGLLGSNDSNISLDLVHKNDKPIEKNAENQNTIAFTLNEIANSLKKSEISIYRYFNDIFLTIIHNFVVKIPMEINQVNYDNLDQIDSTFAFVSQNINLRRWSKKINKQSPGGNYKAFVNLTRKNILVRLYEIHTLDLDIGFSKAIDRVTEVLDLIQEKIGINKIQFAEISEWKIKEKTGKVIQLDCELANHPINSLLQKRVKFAKKTVHWLLIDEFGNKIGFDCSPRKLGKGRSKEPHLEVTGELALEKTDWYLNDLRYSLNKEIGIEKLHEVIRGVRNFEQKTRQKVDLLEVNQKEIIKNQIENAKINRKFVINLSQQKLILDLIESDQQNTKIIVLENQSLLTKVISKLFPQKNIFKRIINKLRG